MRAGDADVSGGQNRSKNDEAAGAGADAAGAGSAVIGRDVEAGHRRAHHDGDAGADAVSGVGVSVSGSVKVWNR